MGYVVSESILFCWIFFLVLDSVKYDPDYSKLLFMCIEYDYERNA